ncbi:hypothetical protein V8E55_004354 [Tylopilus felleus]
MSPSTLHEATDSPLDPLSFLFLVATSTLESLTLLSVPYIPSLPSTSLLLANLVKHDCFRIESTTSATIVLCHMSFVPPTSHCCIVLTLLCSTPEAGLYVYLGKIIIEFGIVSFQGPSQQQTSCCFDRQFSPCQKACLNSCPVSPLDLLGIMGVSLSFIRWLHVASVDATRMRLDNEGLSINTRLFYVMMYTQVPLLSIRWVIYSR